MLTLCHATEVRNLASILKRGLLCRKATRQRKAVWFASEADEQWAIKHCLVNRSVRLDEVVVLTCQVPEDWVRGHRHGLWYVMRDIPPSCIRTVKRFKAEVEVCNL